MRTAFSLSRYVILIAVVALLLGAIVLFVFGGITTITIIVETFARGDFSAEGARLFSVEMIELIDLFLLGTVLFITSLGLYELFIDPSLGELLPSWLSVHNIEQLKFNLVAVLVVMLIVLFLGWVAELESLAEGQGVQILALGAGIALVVAAAGAVVVMLGNVHLKMEASHTEHHTPATPEGQHSGGHD